MSEKLSTPRDERDELAALEAKLARKRAEVEAKENFGKYDYTVPAEGEHTYTSFMESRPKEGVVREGDAYRNAATGAFASEEDYHNSLESQSDYEDRQYEQGMGIRYEDMSMTELAKKMGETEGDISTSNEIMHVLDQKLDAYAEKYHWDKETKDAHLDKLFEIADRSTHPAEAAVAEPKEGESDEFARALDDARQVGDFVRNNPELAEKNGIAEEVRKIQRQIDEVLNPAKPEEKSPLEALDDADAPAVEEESSALDALDDADAPKAKGEKKAGDALDALDSADAPEAKRDEEKKSPLEELEDVDAPEVESKDRWYKRAFARAGVVYGNGLSKLVEKLPNMKEKKNKKRAVFIGAGVIALAGAAVWAQQRYGWTFGLGGHSGGNIDTSNTPTPTGTGGHHGHEAVTTYSHNALTVEPGEGWFNTMKEAGVSDPSVRHALLQDDALMGKLQEMGLAYKAPELGGWGLNMPVDGKMAKEALNLITTAANEIASHKNAVDGK